MELTEHRAGNHHLIREVTEAGIGVDGMVYQRSLIVGARYLETEWPVGSLTDLNESTLRPLIELQPELVLIGVGWTHQVPDPEMQRRLIQHGIGVECMTLPAAARTFNVLMSENRRALAGLIFPGESQATG